MLRSFFSINSEFSATFFWKKFTKLFSFSPSTLLFVPREFVYGLIEAFGMMVNDISDKINGTQQAMEEV